MRTSESETIRMNLPEDQDGQIHINYPQNKNQTKANNSPIVFLLGYAGCKDETLQKYSQIYDQLGCITIRYYFSFQRIKHPVHNTL